MNALIVARRLSSWRWLEKRGWQIATRPDLRGTGACDRAAKTIWLKTAAFTAPSLRVRRYVIPHEIGHALHAELGYECAGVMARGIDYRSAVEAVADAYVLNGTWQMQVWVRASVAWHGRHGYRYRWADVVAPQTSVIVQRLKDQIRA